MHAVTCDTFTLPVYSLVRHRKLGEYSVAALASCSERREAVLYILCFFVQVCVSREANNRI